MAIPRLTGPLSRYPCAIFCGPGMILIVNGSEPAKHRLQPHTRARHSSWRACASDALQAARVASEAGTTCSRCSSQLQRVCSQSTPRPPPAALLFAQLGDAGPSAGHPMRAHIVRTPRAGAVHGRTPAVAARMPPAVMLVINLRIGAAADCCCGNSSSLLLPDSVKPAVQRGVQNSRGLVPPEAERVQTR